jgi:hypothetical protein
MKKDITKPDVKEDEENKEDTNRESKEEIDKINIKDNNLCLPKDIDLHNPEYENNRSENNIIPKLMPNVPEINPIEAQLEEKKQLRSRKKEVNKEKNIIENENIINNKSLIGENEMIKLNKENELELPKDIPYLKQNPEIIGEKKDKEDKEEKEEKEEKEDKEELNKINIRDNVIPSLNDMNLHKPEYSLPLKENIEKGLNMPKMISYSPIIEPIEKEKELEFNKNEYIEKPKENKNIEIDSDYINKPLTNINNLPLMPDNYQINLPEVGIQEIPEEKKKEEEEKENKAQNIMENENVINNVNLYENEKVFNPSNKLPLPDTATLLISQKPEKVKKSESEIVDVPTNNDEITNEEIEPNEQMKKEITFTRYCYFIDKSKTRKTKKIRIRNG